MMIMISSQRYCFLRNPAGSIPDLDPTYSMKHYRKMQEAEERGISGQVSPTSPYSYQEWQIKLEILEMTVEQVLQDER